ncbi:hypothetical protein NL676_025553 [Syzygium grande]|nr:hypothetical protein NL676_025553 [Syzygium grande]
MREQGRGGIEREVLGFQFSSLNDFILPKDDVCALRAEGVHYLKSRVSLWFEIGAKGAAGLQRTQRWLFKPERWLRAAKDDGEKWRLVKRDAFVYPMFWARSRICLGKEMTFLQLKRVVAEVLRRFRVVPAVEEGVQFGNLYFIKF